MTLQRFILRSELTAVFPPSSETAFGYKGLKILLYYIAGSLSTMFRVEYASKVNENFDCVEVRREIYFGLCFSMDCKTSFKI